MKKKMQARKKLIASFNKIKLEFIRFYSVNPKSKKFCQIESIVVVEC